MSADVLLPPLGSIGPNGGFVSVLHVTDALVSIKIFQLQFQLQLLIFFLFFSQVTVKLLFQLLLPLLDFSVSVTVILDQIGVILMRENNNV